MMDALHWVGALCGSETALQGGMLLGLFGAGVAGSVIHCGPMCGVFVLGQASERMARLGLDRLCERQRIGSGLLLPYHLGRLTTYAGLGAVAAGSAAVLRRFAWSGSLSAALLTLAAILFLLHALGRIMPRLGTIDAAPRFWGRLIRLFTRRIARLSPPGGSLVREYLLGVALGFLPCGFLYAAIAVAAASAQPTIGALAMVSFAIGTAPVLMLIGIAGHAAGQRWNRTVTAAAPALMVLNAALLLMMAWQRLT
jgi:sulfite exporter TauE/SafE